MYRYTVTVPQHVPKATLAVYTRHAFSLLPESVLRSAFSARDIKMNGVRCARETMVQPGAEVTVYTPYYAAFPAVFENDRLLAMDKPAGISCDDDAYGSVTVLEWARMHAAGAYEPRMCHRLDNKTSGLMLLAKDEAAEQALREMFAAHAGNKTYVCLVRGTPDPARAKRTAWLRKDARRSQVQVLPREVPGAKPIETAYEVLRPGPVSLLRITLLTGRTHQIRAHMAALGHPVLGDDQYGDRDFNKKWGNGALMLRSVGLTVQTQGKIPDADGIALRVPIKLDQILEELKLKYK
ncbi:MAG: RluA family pseudouridine synthase [Clostridia bacterium]|nr:RluA family pseudouridine synthase [Clostridia bacterium]